VPTDLSMTPQAGVSPDGVKRPSLRATAAGMVRCAAGSERRYKMPENRDGTQCAVSKALLADTKSVHSMHELVDTMIDGG